ARGGRARLDPARALRATRARSLRPIAGRSRPSRYAIFIAATRPEIALFRKKTARVTAAGQIVPLGPLDWRHLTPFEQRGDRDRKSARADLRVYERGFRVDPRPAPGRGRRSEFQTGGK